MQGIFRYSANLDILKGYLQMPILFVTVEKKKDRSACLHSENIKRQNNFLLVLRTFILWKVTEGTACSLGLISYQNLTLFHRIFWLRVWPFLVQLSPTVIAAKLHRMSQVKVLGFTHSLGGWASVNILHYPVRMGHWLLLEKYKSKQISQKASLAVIRIKEY